MSLTKRDPRPRLPVAPPGWYSLVRVSPRSILTARTLLTLLGSIQATVSRAPNVTVSRGPDGFDAVLWTERRPSGDVIEAWRRVGVDLFDVGGVREDIGPQADAIRRSEILTPAGGRAP